MKKIKDDINDKKNENDDLYGLLDAPNIGKVLFGNYEFNPLYGNAAYFDASKTKTMLGYELAALESTNKKHSRIRHNSASFKTTSECWIDNLHVCPYCFKYTEKQHLIFQHQSACKFNSTHPLVGKLVYRDDERKLIIKHIRGFKHLLFCQNLSLFGKLFLNDKSVYYNVDQFDFYVLYGVDQTMGSDEVSGQYIPMGFFSKEVVSWDMENNLACICIFPPFQRRHLGSLLIEFSYLLAAETPGQKISGPELPLSAFGMLSYYRYWSVKLSYLILSSFSKRKSLSLYELSKSTGFRKEDILKTLEYMEVIQCLKNDKLVFSLGNLKQWVINHNIDVSWEKSYINFDSLLI